MDVVDLLERMAVALAIGLLVGLERGWRQRNEREGGRTAGVRTFALAALLGAVWAGIARQLGPSGAVALGLAFVAFSAAVGVFRYRETSAEGTFGATTVIAAMLVFALGAYAMVGMIQVAAAVGVAVAGLLALKGAMHRWLAGVSQDELRSALLLLAMTFILLPLLPNRTIDPWRSVNPFELWLLTILIAALSFAGYVAIRYAGEQSGIVLTGLAGGLVSSTVVTMTMARLAREQPDHRRAPVVATLASWVTMLARVLVVVGVVNPALLGSIAAPIAVAALVFAMFAIPHLAELSRPAAARLVLVNPFELTTVLKQGALLAVVTVFAKFATTYGGASGAYVLAAVSGIADVDAVALSMARLGAGGLDPRVAAEAILIVVGVNTLAKGVLSWVSGGPAFGRVLAPAAIVAVVAGLLGHVARGWM